jgi:hypothetical protein
LREKEKPGAEKTFKELHPSQVKVNEARAKALLTPKPVKPAAKGRVGGPAVPKLTEGMWKANSFGKRAMQGEAEISAIEGSGKPPSADSVATWRKVPRSGMLSMITDRVMPEQIKKQLAAEELFLNAILRNDSGASTPDSEYPRYESQFFVRAGDTPEVIEQKRRARKLAIEQLKAEAGPTWSQTGIQAVPPGKPKAGSPLGTVKKGKGGVEYKKKNNGPDNVKENWEPVTKVKGKS